MLDEDYNEFFEKWLAKSQSDNPGGSTAVPGSAIRAEGIEQTISSWLLYLKSRPSSPADLPDQSGDSD